MGRTKTKRRRRDPLAGYSQRPIGTKAQGRRNEETRGYKNKVFDLEAQLANEKHTTHNLMSERLELMRQVDAIKPTRRQQDAIHAIVRLSVEETERLGITEHVATLSRWNREMKPRDIATGKAGR